MAIKVKWFDAGKNPTCKPDPSFPNGQHIDLSNGAQDTCDVALPYPAKRIGQYLMTCDTCGLTAIATTAGRPDDPRTVTLACKTTKPGARAVNGNHPGTPLH